MTDPGRERPILFKFAMIRAILAGKKTQTRRIVKLPPLQPWQRNSKGWHFIESNHSIDDCNYYIAGFGDGLGTIINIKCPYGKPAFAPFDLPADRLWVREKYMKARCPIAMSNAEQVTRGPAIDENWQHCAWYEDSEADARAEGVTAVCAYRNLWEKIHGPGSWDANPYVWVVEFCQVAPLNQPIATEP